MLLQMLEGVAVLVLPHLEVILVMLNQDISRFKSSEDPDDQEPHFPICLLIQAYCKMWINWIKTGQACSTGL